MKPRATQASLPPCRGRVGCGRCSAGISSSGDATERCANGKADMTTWNTIKLSVLALVSLVTTVAAPMLDGRTGGVTAFVPPPEMAQRPSPQPTNWRTDDPSKELAEGQHIGAKTVSRWREDFLRDFAARMRRCKSPGSPFTVRRDSAAQPGGNGRYTDNSSFGAFSMVMPIVPSQG